MRNVANYAATYQQVAVETASQGKLIVLLYNGAIQRAGEARRQLERGRLDAAHNNLIRAQDILSELRGALNMDAGDVARNLDRVYEYLQHLLIRANVRKEIAPIDECIGHLEGFRDTWQALFDQLGRGAPAAPAAAEGGPARLRGAAVMDLTG